MITWEWLNGLYKRKREARMYKKMILILLMVILSFTICLQAQAQGWEYKHTDIEIANAIWYSEGAESTRYPYGIMSVKVKDANEARRVCLNTIRNNRKRFKSQTIYTNYLEFLADRYCPKKHDAVGNINWKKNVRNLLKNPRRTPRHN